MDNFGQSVGSAGGAAGTVSPSGFDGEDSVFESPNQSPVEITNNTEQAITGEIISDKETSRKIMDIPGTAHDKLEGLANMEVDESTIESVEEEQEPDDTELKDEETLDEESEEDSEDTKEFSKTQESTIEQRIIIAQAEALKMLAKSMSEKVSDKEKEELLNKLKKILEELEKKEDKDKTSLVGAVLSVILIIISIGEKAFKTVEKETKSN